MAVEWAQQAGASYADVRFVEREEESMEVRNGNVEAVVSRSDAGFGVRVIADGAWGFAGSSRAEAEEVERVAKLAVRIARASAQTRQAAVRLADTNPVRETVVMPITQDPFEVPYEERIDLLLAADRSMRQVEGVRITEAEMLLNRESKLFVSTEGAAIHQVRTETGVGIAASAVSGQEVQRRSYPNSHGGEVATRGYELVEELDLCANGRRIAEEAVALLSAPVCPVGDLDLVLEGSQLALQVHESCGHPIEFDRVLGTEASFAGTSFLTPDKLRTLQYGSPLVNITADATLPRALGSFPYDDEGVPGQLVPIMEKGVFVGYLTSRETAAVLGQASNGTMRADGWNRIPLIRMTNINLLPGDWSFEELLADTKEGLYLATNKSWSIDDRRLNFQFGTEIAFEIKSGTLGRIFRNPVYQGMTPEFWNRCDAICGSDEWHVWGVANCGKGEPTQSAHVGHGTAPARFRRVRVGAGL